MERQRKVKKQVAKWLTAVMPGRAWGVVLSLAGLSVMGLVFLWYCPDAASFTEWMGGHWMFRRQVVWLGIGVSVFGLAVMVGWRRWLKAAPWLAVGWLALFVIAIGSPQVGHNLYARVGAVQLDIPVFCPLAVALLLAWIAEKLPGRRALGVLLVVAVVAVGMFAVWTLDGCEGMARIFGRASVETSSPDEVMLREWAQDASCEAVREAHWLSGNDEVLRQKSLPGRYSCSMPFSAALVFGKWFNALALVLFGVFAAMLACCYHKARGAAKKLFVAATGLFILSMAACGYSAYFGLVPPMLHTCVPLVSYGGGVVAMAWLMAGIIGAGVRAKASRTDMGGRANRARRTDIGGRGRIGGTDMGRDSRYTAREYFGKMRACA